MRTPTARRGRRGWVVKACGCQFGPVCAMTCIHRMKKRCGRGSRVNSEMNRVAAGSLKKVYGGLATRRGRYLDVLKSLKIVSTAFYFCL